MDSEGFGPIEAAVRGTIVRWGVTADRAALLEAALKLARRLDAADDDAPAYGMAQVARELRQHLEILAGGWSTPSAENSADAASAYFATREGFDKLAAYLATPTTEGDNDGKRHARKAESA